MQKYHHIKNSIIGPDSIISYDDFKLINNYEKDLYMESKSIIIGNELIGYFFYFTSLYYPKPNNFFNYKLENRDSQKNTKVESTKKSKKYQVAIKSKNFLASMRKNEESILKRLEVDGAHNINRDNDDFSNIKYLRKSVQEPKVRFRRKSSKTFLAHDPENFPASAIEDDTIINGEFVPDNPFFLDFDYTDCSYLKSKSLTNEKLNELQREAEEKMNKIIKIKFENKRIIKRIFNDTNSEEEEESKDGVNESSSVFSSSSNYYTDKLTPPSEEISKKNSIVKI